MRGRILLFLAAVGVFHGGIRNGSAQELEINAKLLDVGDPAPKLTVQEFLLGEPVAQFEKGKIYVVEITARYCLGCQLAIPHLTELQKKYPNVAVISVYAYGNQDEIPPFVKKNRARMGYRVAIDAVPDGQDPEQSGAMVKNWMKPAGLNGVPYAFIIDGTCKIAWIGDPQALDHPAYGKPLEKICSGKWDWPIRAAKSKQKRTEQLQRRIAALSATEQEALKEIQRTADDILITATFDERGCVSLSSTEMTDAMLQKLMKNFLALRGLRSLNLCSSRVTDVGLKELRRLENLKDFKDLNLSYTQVTDEGLKELRDLKGLQTLQLNHTAATGAGLKYLREMRGLHLLCLQDAAITDAGLKELPALSGLETLWLDDTQMTDVGLRALGKLKRLRTLALDGTRTTDAGLKELEGLTELTSLRISRTHVTDAGLKALHNMKQLQWLQLNGTQVTDAGLKELLQLQGLRGLDLAETQVTDAGLKVLQKLPKLLTLTLNDTQVTDAGLQELKGLSGLNVLFMAGTQVTDASLRMLKEFPSLGRVDVSRTKVTNNAVANLQKASPKLMIIH